MRCTVLRENNLAMVSKVEIFLDSVRCGQIRRGVHYCYASAPLNNKKENKWLTMNKKHLCA